MEGVYDCSFSFFTKYVSFKSKFLIDKISFTFSVSSQTELLIYPFREPIDFELILLFN